MILNRLLGSLVFGLVMVSIASAFYTIGEAQGSYQTFLPFSLTGDKFPERNALLIQKSTLSNTLPDLYWVSAGGNLDYRITRNTTYKRMPLVSSTGDYVVYQGEESLNFIDAYGNQIATINNDKAINYFPGSWAKDDSYFWYLGEATGEDTFTLYTVDVHTSQTETIASNVYSQPSSYFQSRRYRIFWLPDHRLAYTEKEQYSVQPYLVNADGTGHQRLNVPFPSASILNVLPDGRIVVFDGTNTYIVNPDGSDLTYFPVGGDTISPDGLLAGNAGGIRDINGNVVVEFEYPSCGGSSCYFPQPIVWSPDGEYIVMARTVDYLSGSFRYELYIARTDGSQTEPTLVKSEGYQYGIRLDYSFSPDSTRFAYTAGQHTFIWDIAQGSEIPVAPLHSTIQGGWR